MTVNDKEKSIKEDEPSSKKPSSNALLLGYIASVFVTGGLFVIAGVVIEQVERIVKIPSILVSPCVILVAALYVVIAKVLAARFDKFI